MLAPTVLTDVTPDMKVCAKEVFGPVVASPPTTTSTRRSAWPTTPDYGLQAAIFTTDIGDGHQGRSSTLDFGGVLVNEVPTWRADQQPYGGVRDSGNTREGPAYSVREMTEMRMVVINP